MREHGAMDRITETCDSYIDASMVHSMFREEHDQLAFRALLFEFTHRIRLV